jgi:hypothetical protein
LFSNFGDPCADLTAKNSQNLTKFHPQRSFYSSDDSFRTPMESPSRDNQYYWRNPLNDDAGEDSAAFSRSGRTSSTLDGTSGTNGDDSTPTVVRRKTSAEAFNPHPSD